MTNDKVNLPRTLKFTPTKGNKFESYRHPINDVKKVCTVNGTKRGASTLLYFQVIENDKGIQGIVWCNKPLSVDQALTYFQTLKRA